MKTILALLFTLTFIPTTHAVKLVYGACDASDCVQRFKDAKKHARKHISANIMLGDMYLNGYGTDVDEEEALEAYEKAGRWGSWYGKYKAGLMLIERDDTEEKIEGLAYLRDAAKRGHADAVYFMAEVLSNPRYGLEDIPQADEWLAVITETTHPYVPQTLARLKREGKLDAAHFPKTMSLIKSSDITVPDTTTAQSNKRAAQIPDNIEVIQVNGPQLAELIDFGIEYYEKAPSNINKVSTGTRIRGRTCEDVVGCSSVPLDQFMRYYRTFIMGR